MPNTLSMIGMSMERMLALDAAVTVHLKPSAVSQA